MRVYRAFCLTLFVASALPAEFQTAAWKFEAAIRLPAQLDSPAFVRLTLPDWVLANAREDLSDLRVINAGIEIPYVLEKAEDRTPETVPAAIVRQSEDLQRQTTDLIVETPMGKQHFEECVVKASDDNFERSVTVSYRDRRGAWVEAGNGSIHRFTVGPVIDEDLIVRVRDLNHKQFRIRIWNYDSPPLSVRSVIMRRTLRILIFDASPTGRYRLFFASSGGDRPNYDLAGALARVDLKTLREASLQSMRPNLSYSPQPTEKPWTERHPTLLWTALGLGVLLLAGLLLRTIRSVS